MTQFYVGQSLTTNQINRLCARFQIAVTYNGRSSAYHLVSVCMDFDYITGTLYNFTLSFVRSNITFPSLAPVRFFGGFNHYFISQDINLNLMAYNFQNHSTPPTFSP